MKVNSVEEKPTTAQNDPAKQYARNVNFLLYYIVLLQNTTSRCLLQLVLLDVRLAISSDGRALYLNYLLALFFTPWWQLRSRQASIYRV